MARKKSEDNGQGKPESKMDGVRILLNRNPKMKAAEIAEAMKTEFDMDMNQATAASYRYSILKKTKKQKRAAARAAGSQAAPVALSEPSIDEAGALDDLLRAAGKVGWRRIKEVVDLVVQAPV
jgi:hypothetical protein